VISGAASFVGRALMKIATATERLLPKEAAVEMPLPWPASKVTAKELRFVQNCEDARWPPVN
jgi:hypothetical protein